MKILAIVGTRPQFIKLAPLHKVLSENSSLKVLNTGQHYDDNMSKIFIDELRLKEPDYNLNIISNLHGEQTGRMIAAIENVLLNENPDLVLIFGDTNSTLAGAISASKLLIKTIHIESGLRSFNKIMPEEINRIVADHVSNFLFAPTETAMKNLKNEGLINKAYLTGDIMVDTLMNFSDLSSKKSKILEKLDIEKKSYHLLTLHRPYTVDDSQYLNEILQKLLKLDKKIIFPVHPRTKSRINIKEFSGSNIIFLEPLGYLDFICLEANCLKILTDSGGVQKEAYILGKPCITLRPETEWTETVEYGWNILINPNNSDFIEKINSFNPSGNQMNIFGENVADKMIDIITGVKF